MKASNEFEKAILTYLEEAKNTYPNMSEALKQEGKNLTDCCNYIIEQVKKKGVNAMANSDVFALANEYYLSKKEIKPKKINCKVVVTSEGGEVPKVEPLSEPKTRSKKKEKEVNPANGTQLSMFEFNS